MEIIGQKHTKRHGFQGDKHAERLIRWGLSTEDYFKKLEDQRGVCAICFNPETSPNKKKDKSGKSIKLLAIDHDHKTNKIRGLLCTRCNLGLGYFKDNPNRLKAAIDYLEKYS